MVLSSICAPHSVTVLMATILSIPPPPQPHLLLLHHNYNLRHRPYSPLVIVKPPTFTTTICFSTTLPTPSPTAKEDDPPPPPPPPPPAAAVEAEVYPPINVEDPSFRGCKTCGKEEVEKGCNGEGRIQGGIATVPGFQWWPIKAFRPCPGFVASGGRYRRRGQSMDEVAFGRGEIDASTKRTTKPSKRSPGTKKIKG